MEEDLYVTRSQEVDDASLARIHPTITPLLVIDVPLAMILCYLVLELHLVAMKFIIDVL